LTAGLSLLVLLAALFPSAAGFPQSRSPASPSIGEEFVGPFPSWTNVKTVYHAVGDGSVDDTHALQNALNELGRPGHAPVLFIPSGRYRITRTLTLEYNIFVSVVGEDPASVALVWDGPVGGTMLLVNGVAYSRFTRLTYDGTGKASVAVEQSWDGSKPHFDTGNEYSDHVFVGVDYGIRGGFNGHGFAETTIVRSRFIRNAKAGVALGNFNALDIWIWYSTFEDCGMGVTNEPGAGNYHVYGSVFQRSTIADLYMKNTGGFSARGNYSTGSKAFFVSAGPISHPATIDIQGNTILDPVDAVAFRLGNQGPGLLLDNIVRSRPGASGPIVQWRSFIDADVTSVGNLFTVADPLSANGRLITVDDRIVAPAAVNPIAPTLPAVRPNLKRMVFEVAPDADGAAIQRAIDAAAARIGTRPVVHIPFGTYAVARTLTVPPGDLQLVGDGFTTVLKWAGADQGPVLRIAGPTTATLRELRVEGDHDVDSIVVDNIDQPGARVYLDGIQLQSGRESNLFVDHLTHTAVELTDVGHSESPIGVSIKTVGSTMTIFSGASSSNGLSYEASEGAHVLLRDLWYEGNTPGFFANVHDQATFTIQASRVSSPPGQGTAAVSIANLNGRVSILTTHIDDRIAISGNGAHAEVLGLGTVREYRESNYFLNTSLPPAAVLMAMTRQRTKAQGRFSPGTRPVTDIGTVDAAFVRRMLAPARAEVLPATLVALPSGVSDVRMFRVWAAGGLNNIRLTAAVGQVRR
jgi:hypothetical protein